MIIFIIIIIGYECNMTNNFWISHILPKNWQTYFTNLKASEMTEKYEKRGKYWPYSTG